MTDNRILYHTSGVLESSEDLGGGPEEALAYTQFRHNTCTSYRIDFDINKDTINALSDLKRRNTASLRLAARHGDHEATLELGIRLHTGAECPKNGDAAIKQWMSLVADPATPKDVRARAHSALSSVWWGRRAEEDEIWNIDSVYRAAMNADKAISLGLVSGSALMAGFGTEAAGFRRAEDNRFPEWSVERFVRLHHLWKALDTRKREVEAEGRKREDKVSKAPNRYSCAAEDCPITATSGTALRACGGKCPRDIKPSYCSKECQKKDWPRHKVDCKPGTKPRPPSQVEIPMPMDAMYEGEGDDDDDKPLSEQIGVAHLGDGQEHMIDLPNNDGGYIRMASKTMSPKWMKELRDQLAQTEADQS